jgi:stage III sporulation protein SpoIIIAA
MIIDNDLEKLIQIFPESIKNVLQKHAHKTHLIEIIMDLGRRPEGRFTFGPEYLSEKVVSWQDLDYLTKRLGRFSDDNRAGLEKTLHRISCIRNRQGMIIGLTCRVGRSIVGTISMIRDLLESGESLLVLGKPGVGKTTMIREISRVLSDEMEKRVVIIDTSNEIAGDSDVPNAGIGRARRMQVSRSEDQHNVMIEAVENHMPEVIIVDEIGTELEALATRTIAERGVQLVGTAHGNSISSLIKNPTLSDLLGGIQAVTLSDDEARRRGTQKSVLERKAVPTFQIAIEINQKNCWIIHEKVDESVDMLLHGQQPNLQFRFLGIDGKINIDYTHIANSSVSFFKKSYQFSNSLVELAPISQRNSFTTAQEKSQLLKQANQNSDVKSAQDTKNIPLYIYSFSLSNHKLEKLCKSFGINIILTKEIDQADIIVASKACLKQNNKLRQLAKNHKIPIYAINSNTVGQITKTLRHMVELNSLKR